MAESPSTFVVACPKGCIGIFQLETMMAVNADLIQIDEDSDRSEADNERRIWCGDCGYEGTVAEFKAAEVERQTDPLRAQYL